MDAYPDANLFPNANEWIQHSLRMGAHIMSDELGLYVDTSHCPKCVQTLKRWKNR